MTEPVTPTPAEPRGIVTCDESAHPHTRDGNCVNPGPAVHTPGAGLELLRREHPGMVPDLPPPPPVLPVEGFDGHLPVFTDVECPQCDGGRCDCLGKLVQICAQCDEDWPCERIQAYERGREHGKAEGIAEGLRQATEGWERIGYVVLIKEPDNWDAEIHETRERAEAELPAARVGNPEAFVAAVIRVGPWEPAEQPEPAPVRTIGGCPGCGQPITGVRGEPYGEDWSRGYREALSVATTYLPCGCTKITPTRPAEQPEGSTS